ncbi:hypothetical protein ASC61_05450 [Aeromicrobium sp. Root344]|uniref:hypothetical protein n=1 Tax=Aeromicrobium sp. Root344 TaxID=1736521 RepID=UPI0006F4E720|nr:hypothetical protein [Aeromicrobium sp. Root344]KQV74491.1 hypothetical protein ASC61_05450 [Aeromicrobium sp. Root344]
MRYYVLSTPAGDEVVRLSGGSAAYFETSTGRWVPDPLLAAEVRFGGEWRQVESHELPPGVAPVNEEQPRLRKSRSLRRGRHTRK